MEALRVPAVDRWVVGVCKMGALSPDDFNPHEGGIRLKPDRLAVTISKWEEHWTEGRHDDGLEKTVQDFISQVRLFGAALPTPSAEDVEP